MNTTISYKGFTLDWKCRDHQFEVGKTFSLSGPVIRCGEGGFHSCENPLEVFDFYAPGQSRYAVVETSGETARDTSGSSTKIASATISVKVELNIPEIVKHAIAWITARCDGSKGQHTTTERAIASATGYQSASSATG